MLFQRSKSATFLTEVAPLMDLEAAGALRARAAAPFRSRSVLAEFISFTPEKRHNETVESGFFCKTVRPVFF
jgi:hypothetical protein